MQFYIIHQACQYKLSLHVSVTNSFTQQMTMNNCEIDPLRPCDFTVLRCPWMKCTIVSNDMDAKWNDV